LVSRRVFDRPSGPQRNHDAGRTQVMTVRDLGERRLLARIVARLEGVGRPTAREVIGIGDDAAVVAPALNALMVLTTDASVEVHFDRTPLGGGHRLPALAVNLSDWLPWSSWMACFRWRCRALLVGRRRSRWIAELSRRRARGREPTAPRALMDITAVGEMCRTLTRSGGRSGDELYVSGRVGAAADCDVAAGAVAAASIQASDACIARYRRPAPRVRLGEAIAQARAASAAMDLSDGLADAIAQVAGASECGVEIDADAVPIDHAARAWWAAQGIEPLTAAMTGGDDYELLIAVPRSETVATCDIARRTTGVAADRQTTKDVASRVLVRNGQREPLPEGSSTSRAGKQVGQVGV
jgi:thiamine-monophosphate kinase